MDKQTAQQTLDQLQKSIADAQRQAKELQAIIDKPDVTSVYQGRITTLDISTKAFTIENLSVTDCTVSTPTVNSPNGIRIAHGIVFNTKDEAKDYLKYLKLRQKARVAMAEAWGDQVPSWDVFTSPKFCVVYNGEKAVCRVETYGNTYMPIHFPSREGASNFLNSLTKEEAELLIKGM